VELAVVNVGAVRAELERIRVAGVYRWVFIGDPEPGLTPLQALGVQLVTVWGTVESLVQTTDCPGWIVSSAGWNSNSQVPVHETMDTPTWVGRVVVVVGTGLVVVVVAGGGLFLLACRCR
jgi:hypothetical protein